MAQSIISAGPYVFLSYLSADRARVLPIARELEKAGVRVWIDMFSIPAGANYGLAIAEGIQHCSAVLIACSPGALQSRNVKQEIQLAWKHQRPYLPLLLEPTTFPQEIEYWLEGYQWVEILDHPKEDWLPRVIQALKKLGVPTTYSPAGVVPTGKPARIKPAPVSTAPERDLQFYPATPAATTPLAAMTPVMVAGADSGIPMVVKRAIWPVVAAGVGIVLAVAVALVIVIAPGGGNSPAVPPASPPSIGDASSRDAAIQPEPASAGLPGTVPTVPAARPSPTPVPSNPGAVPVMPMGS